MRRIFWDAPVLIYMTERNPKYIGRVSRLFQESIVRGDRLLTSYVALGEIMVGAGRNEGAPHADAMRTLLSDMGFEYLAFDGTCVETFRSVRAQHRVKAPDAIHLACAAGAEVDVFLTNDEALTRLHVPGIKFIVDLETSLFK